MMDSMKPVTFAIIGGDLRQRSLADDLAEKGFPVRLFALETLEKPVRNPHITVCTSLASVLQNVGCIIAPLPICDEMMRITAPFSKEHITVTALLDDAPPDAVLLGGDIFDDLIDHEHARLFLAGVAEHIPCYYVTGNHD